MRQQINLFQAVLIDKPEPLQASQVKLILGLFIALLTVLSLFGYWQLNNAEQQMSKLQLQKDTLESQVVALEKKFPERQKSALLIEEIHRSEGALAGQKKLLGYFSLRSNDGNGSILAILSGLAQHRAKGIWLRRIQLSTAGRDIALDGTALRPEQVPQYLQSLGEQKVLVGKVFSRLSLARLDERSGQVDFSLESLADEQ